MKTMTHNVMKPAVAVLVAALTTSAVVMTAEAASKSGNETVSISEYTGWGDPAMAKIAIDSGRALVAHLSTARALLPEMHWSSAGNSRTRSNVPCRT